jgi:hypothetical protein
MSVVANEPITADIAARKQSLCVKSGAILRQMSWALSYPSAATDHLFRKFLTEATAAGSLKKCA